MVESSWALFCSHHQSYLQQDLKQHIIREFCQGCGFPASLEHLSWVGPASIAEARKLAWSASLADRLGRFTRDLGFFHQTCQGKTLIQKWAMWRSREHLEPTFWWGWHWLPAWRGPGIQSSAPQTENSGSMSSSFHHVVWLDRYSWMSSL